MHTLLLLGLAFAQPVSCAPIAQDPATQEKQIVVDFARKRPVTIDKDGLQSFWAQPIVARIEKELDAQQVVGLSAAFVIDSEVVDVRSWGWEDFGKDLPATGKTLYRWASITKPMTAIIALQLAAEGKLDLDADVRNLVPEFPEKQYAVHARHILSHQSGIVHYQHGPVVTQREYESKDPFRDRILAIDMFKESPLIFKPGSATSYSTHAYVLLGAVLQRAGGKTYAQLIDERIATPLGMDTLRPDYQGEDIPHNTRGYSRVSGGRVIDSGDSNVAWKLPAGGFVSTVGDLARFASGLVGDELLDEELFEALTSRQKLNSGKYDGWGAGIKIGGRRNLEFLMHSGGQLKTSTMLLACPQAKLAVVLMCNTQGTGLSRLADDLMDILLGQ